MDERAYAVDGDQVCGPDDLPPALWLGIREDAGFRRTPRGFICPYVFEGRVVQFLEYEEHGSGSAVWRFADVLGEAGELSCPEDGARSESVLRVSCGPGLLEALQQHALPAEPPCQDPRERWIGEEMAAVAGVEYSLEREGAHHAAYVPDGRLKCLVLPLNEEWAQGLRTLQPEVQERFRASVTLQAVQRMVLATSSSPLDEETVEIIHAAAAASVEAPVSASHATLPGSLGGSHALLLLQPVVVAYAVVIWRHALPLVRFLAERGVLPPPGPSVLSRGVITEAARAAAGEVYAPVNTENAVPPPGEFLVVYPKLEMEWVGKEMGK
jgi:hypothetical protein